MSHNGPGPPSLAEVLGILERYLGILKTTKPETKSLVLHCPENTAEFSLLIQPSLIRKKIKTKLRFPGQHITKFDLLTLRTFTSQPQAISKEGSDYVVDMSKLSEESESALLVVEYEVEAEDVIRKLVDRKSQADTIGVGDEDRYWMHAGLRHVAALEDEYASIDLKDVEVRVDVGIYERLRAAMPRVFIDRAEALARLVRESDRNKRVPLMLEYLRSRTMGGSSDDFSKFAELQTLFSTRSFREFVDVEQPFHYERAQPGKVGLSAGELLDLPKIVEVVSRTDLSRKQPVAKGYLVYKSKKFQARVDDLFR